MCISTPKVTPAPTIVDRDDAQVRQARSQRIQLGQQAGGNLATRLTLGGGNTDNRIKLGQ